MPDEGAEQVDQGAEQDDEGAEQDNTDSLTASPVVPTADLILNEVRELRGAFDAKIRYDEVRERLVESMSEELAQYREDVYQNLLRPVLFDLVAMYDDLSQLMEAPDCLPSTADSLRLFRESVEQALARNGVEPYTVAEHTVDRSRQKVLSVEETPHAAQQRQVARRLRPGFSWNGRVLRPEWVSAYRHIEAPASAEVC